VLAKPRGAIRDQTKQSPSMTWRALAAW